MASPDSSRNRTAGDRNNAPPIDDPAIRSSWHLDNTGQTFKDSGGSISGKSGFDMRVFEAWEHGYTGKGVRVAVVDDGIETDHSELDENIDERRGYDLANERRGGAPESERDGHGTSVAGVIAAEGDNGSGSAGVAYDASLVSLRFGENEDGEIDAQSQDEQLANAFDRARTSGSDISNNAWGRIEPTAANPDIQEAMERFATDGRDGLGGVVTFAAGNERTQTLSANLQGDQNNPYAIPVASVDQTGKFSVFSSPGANVVLTAPGENIKTTVLTDTGDDRADMDTRNGTSFSTASVSGVAALVLDANPDLTGRDVQEILVHSAYRTDSMKSYLADIDEAEDARSTREYEKWFLEPDEGDVETMVTPWVWQTNGADNWNGGGHEVSHDYGFGMVDAAAATRLAKTWKPSRSSEWDTLEIDGQGNKRGGIEAKVDDDERFTVSKATVSLDLAGPDVDGDASRREEREALLDYVEKLDIQLVSPSGTTSHLVSGFDADQYDEIADRQQTRGAGVRATDTSGNGLVQLKASSADDDGSDPPFLLTTAQVWGEDAAGTWEIQATNAKTGKPLKLDDWSLKLYGEEKSSNDTYVFTDAFGDLTAEDADRERLRDLDGGDNTINASTVTSDLDLDLRVGSRSEIAGGELRIGKTTKITDAYAGEGDDVITGTAAPNQIRGGRGDDTIRGHQDEDRFWGGGGDDLLRGNKGEDHLYGQAGDDRLYGGGGKDVLVGGEGDDIYRGGTGSDIFVVNGDDPGKDAIKDFETGRDTLKFESVTTKDGRDLTSFGRIEDDIKTKGDNVVITYEGGSLTIDDVDVDDISADDMIIA